MFIALFCYLKTDDGPPRKMKPKWLSVPPLFLLVFILLKFFCWLLLKFIKIDFNLSFLTHQFRQFLLNSQDVTWLYISFCLTAFTHQTITFTWYVSICTHTPSLNYNRVPCFCGGVLKMENNYTGKTHSVLGPVEWEVLDCH